MPCPAHNQTLHQTPESPAVLAEAGGGAGELAHTLQKRPSMTPEEAKKERNRIYASTRQDLLIRNLSNSEKYDNAILTLSTGVLGISLAFIKDIVPLDRSQYVFLLKTSWWVFGLSIVSTLVSFVLSQLAIKRQLKYAEKYYLEEEDWYLKKKNHPALWTEFVNYASGILFIAGILATICFVSINIKEGGHMPKDAKEPIFEGAEIPKFQKIETGTEKRGAIVPEMQPLKPTTSNTQQSRENAGKANE